MTYCSNLACLPGRVAYISDKAHHCQDCGTELTPAIRCLTCAQQGEVVEINPRQLTPYCRGCGTKLTDDYLGQCMSQQLAGMVKEIAERKSVEATLN